MLWKALPRGNLSRLIELKSPGLLQRLQDLLPLVGDDIGDIGDRAVLATIAESFLPSDLLLDAAVRRELLMFLPPARLARVKERVIADGSSPSTFVEDVDALVRLPPETLIGALVELSEVNIRFKPVPAQSVAGSVRVEPASEMHPVSITGPFRQLLDYQHFIFAKCAEVLDSPRARAILQMPTGAGKTRTAMEIIAARMNANDGAVIVWLAHSEELCDQAFDSFVDVSTHLARKPVTVIRNWGGLHSGGVPNGNAFVVTTYQTLCRGGGALTSVAKERVALIVADEAHMAIAPKYKQAIVDHLGPNTCILGLTATPIRPDSAESQELREFFFHTIVSSSDHGDFSTKRLQERGILATPTFVVAESSAAISVSEKESRTLAEDRDVSGKVLRTLSEDASRNALIARHCISLSRQGKSVLVFACGIEHSRFLASLLLTCGVKAAHVDGASDPSYRRTTIEAFRRGETSVLCNFGVLTTGFDAPNIDAVVLARPTLSKVLYSQMVGRAMRGPAMGGKAQTTVIDIRDNFRMFGRPLVLFESFRAFWSDALA